MYTFRSESQAQNQRKSITGSRFGFLTILFLKYCTCYIEILNKEPKTVDLLKIFDGFERQYRLIGVSLEVFPVDDIKYDNVAPKESLISVFDRWRAKNKDVTWKMIKQVCDDFPDKFGKVKSSLDKYLSSEEGRKKYLGKK